MFRTPEPKYPLIELNNDIFYGYLISYSIYLEEVWENNIEHYQELNPIVLRK